MTITKANMTERLIDELDLNPQEAKVLVEDCFEELRVTLAQGELVKLSGFGNFDRQDKRSRPGRNPRTGEEHVVTARRVVIFRPGQKLKAQVND